MMNRKSSRVPTSSASNENAADDAIEDVAVPAGEENENIEHDDDNDVQKDSVVPPFDRRAVSRKLLDEEFDEIKKSQRFLQMQQRRRMLDKTWLDRGITSVIEFFENVFRWEVIDV
ncbi:hypothetical protein ACHAXA_003784 [Cyclostephanos tholiformis]|jgi:hypothetical protein|uniref:Uncharacterized protein n=1 Tax=Cyclostephanos tholiformis TaxID=382380 RepID=A0ABD3ST37_9STRA